MLPFFYKSGPWLGYNLVLIPLIFADWNDYDRQCALTSLEAKLRGKWRPAEAEGGGPAFFQPLVNKLLGLELTRSRAESLNIILFLASFIVSAIRYTVAPPLPPTTKLGWGYFILGLLYATIYVVNIFVRT